MDLDTANVLTQNRVSQATSRLPQEVNAAGRHGQEAQPAASCWSLSLYSPNGTYDSQFLNNYATINVRDALLRVPGVAQVDLFGGAEYGMRVWLRPDQLAKLGLTPADVIAAIKEQNIQAPAGQIGAAPSPPGQEFTYTVRAPGKLTTPEEFENILVRTTDDGRPGAASRTSAASSSAARTTSRSAASTASRPACWPSTCCPAPTSSQAAEGIYAALEELKKHVPRGRRLQDHLRHDARRRGVDRGDLHTLLEAVVLVILVVFVFLQSWRATLIPLLTVPVSLVGTFIFFPLLGFTVNTLSMFGLVLAIGIVVDDAIVVVEAVMHHIEHGLSPKDATVKAMEEVSGAVVGIALVLSAVFIPVAFIGGLTGSHLPAVRADDRDLGAALGLQRAVAVSPALCAMLLKPATPARRRACSAASSRLQPRVRPHDRPATSRCASILARRAVLALVAIAVVGRRRRRARQARCPHGFVPDEDQGIFLVNVQLPNASSLERTDTVVRAGRGDPGARPRASTPTTRSAAWAC